MPWDIFGNFINEAPRARRPRRVQPWQPAQPQPAQAPPEPAQAADIPFDWNAMQLRALEQLRRQQAFDAHAFNPFAPPPPPQPEAKEYQKPEKMMITSTKPPFFMPYDNIDEVRMRLEGSIIRLDGMPIFVMDARLEGGKFIVYFRRRYNDLGNTEKVEYKDGNGLDLAPFQAQYMQRGNNTAVWVYRMPVRGVYKQGATSKNTYYKYMGGRDRGAASMAELMTLYAEGTPVRRFSSVTGKLHPERGYSFALSSQIAVLSSDKCARVEYKGITIGEVERGQEQNPQKTYAMKSLNPDITINPWCQRKLDEVGLYIQG